MSGGEDVAALVAFGLFGHGIPLLSLKVFKIKDLSSDFVLTQVAFKVRRPGGLPGLFFVYSSILSSGIKLMGTYFCACKSMVEN